MVTSLLSGTNFTSSQIEFEEYKIFILFDNIANTLFLVSVRKK